MPSLAHCMYVSSAAQKFDAHSLQSLVAESREKNLRLGVTGILVFMSGRFFQILEGERSVVQDVFASIQRDSRHTGVTQIISETIHKRSFEHWSMGLADLSGDKLTQIISLTTSDTGMADLRNLPDGRARKLLQAFCDGRWSATVSQPASTFTLPAPLA